MSLADTGNFGTGVKQQLYIGAYLQYFDIYKTLLNQGVTKLKKMRMGGTSLKHPS